MSDIYEEEAAMTLVILGLVGGLVGLVWLMVLDIVRSDRQCQRTGSQKSERHVTGPVQGESRAA